MRPSSVCIQRLILRLVFSRFLRLIVLRCPHFFFIVLIFLATGGLMINQIVVAASYNATGWQWYSKDDDKNDEKEEDEIVEQNLQQTQTIQSSNAAKLLKNQNQKKQKNQESYSAQLKAFQAHYEEMQAKAVLTRKVEDVAYVMYLRMFMMEQAKDYGRSFEKALLHYPNLSYALKFPTQDRAREITREHQHKRQQQAIQSYAKTHGLFYFYKGQDSHSKAFGSSVQHFADQYGITLIGVAVDGVVIGEIKENMPIHQNDEMGKNKSKSKKHWQTAQLRQWGVKAVPALFLYNNQTKAMQPFAYGFMAQDQMAERFLQMATDYDQKPLQGDVSHDII